MKIPALAGLATTVALVATSLVATQAQANPGGVAPIKKNSLASVLAVDGNSFDSNWDDFDIVDRAINKVLTDKPDSAVSVLTDGETAVTAFIPTDRAFRKLARSLSGTRPATERDAWKAVRAATHWDIDTLETILLYHVDIADTTTYFDGFQNWNVGLDSTYLTNELTAAAPTPVPLTVATTQTILASLSNGNIALDDADDSAINPRVTVPDINLGNIQIAHGINRVLRPAVL